MGTVLYEIHPSFGPFILIPLIGIISILASVCLPKASNDQTDEAVEQRENKLAMGLCGGLFFLIVGFLGTMNQIMMYRELNTAYQAGTYNTAEGYVDHYAYPAPGTKNDECFRINGVYFSYSDTLLSAGYNTPKDKGGVISGNGQYLKVGYVYFDDIHRNVIIYIEELDPPA